MNMFKTLKNYVLDENIIECVEGLDRSEMVDGEKSTCGREIAYVREVIEENVFTDEVCWKYGDKCEDACILGSEVLSDLEVLRCYDGTEEGSLIGRFTECKFGDNDELLRRRQDCRECKNVLRGSQIFLKHLLSNPISNIESLKVRQQTIRDVYTKYKECTNIDKSFAVLKSTEMKMCWFYDSHKDISDNLHDMVYLNIWFLDWLNKSDVLLTGYNIYRILLSPLIGIMTPILYIIVPYLILRMKYKLMIPFSAYVKMNLSIFLSSNTVLPQSLDRFRKISIALTILFYFQSLFNTFELSRAIFRLTKILVTKMNGLINFIHHGQKIIKHFDPSLTHSVDKVMNAFHIRFQSSNAGLSKPEYFSDLFANESAEKDNDTIGGIAGDQFSILSNFGKQLSLYKYLQLNDYKHILQKVYFYDNILCVGKNGNASMGSENSENENGPTMSFVEYHDPSYLQNKGESENTMHTVEPYLNIRGFYHPCMGNMPFHQIIKNDKCFGTSRENVDERNMILTGPNAGGKSTVIKSIMISILLAQTLGIANAESLELIPFKFINTQINIPDSKGKQSLFEAEMFRAKTNFDTLALLKPSDTAVIAMDEIFSSTNPVEGIAGAYAIAKRLGEKKNVINIISTHFIYLSKLRQLREESNGKQKRLFCNLKMNVNVDEQNSIVEYPYKLSKGISRQFIALELLRKNGFDKDIIDEAVSIKNEFLKT